jgi:hypothetical protein
MSKEQSKTSYLIAILLCSLLPALFSFVLLWPRYLPYGADAVFVSSMKIIMVSVRKVYSKEIDSRTAIIGGR